MAWKSILESLAPRGGPGPDPWEGVGEGINPSPEGAEGLLGRWEDGSARPPTPRGLVGFVFQCFLHRDKSAKVRRGPVTQAHSFL